MARFVWDTPTLVLRTSRGTRQEYDVPGLAGLLAPYTGPHAHVVIEEAQAMPGQGTRSMFTIGLGMGVWLGILGALGLAHTRIRPAVWKRALGLTSDGACSQLQCVVSRRRQLVASACAAHLWPVYQLVEAKILALERQEAHRQARLAAKREARRQARENTTAPAEADPTAT
jgi:hypothetical protein